MVRWAVSHTYNQCQGMFTQLPLIVWYGEVLCKSDSMVLGDAADFRKKSSGLYSTESFLIKKLLGIVK